ncbi:hypothetical protein J1N10_18690 [Carboxylicivirga sp. A043]|uniref:hypothetical protein n=1 Tax=Carboxylicivirga litoralis TaxID=2816963 RepID=UPI0021CB1BE6|nr:hypothetical protein [Carboxylicivirga sp. A043]MCU4158009.1 hypothetical protein [Carboxylicivirga sp. A043]
MTELYKLELELFADYFQIYIQDEEADDDLSLEWTDEAVDRLLAIKEGVIAIGTVRNMDVPVKVKVYDSEPEILNDKELEIGQINECDLKVSSEKVVVSGCTDYFPDAKRIELPNGTYRTRIYYGKLDTLSEDELDGDDFYEVHLWKTNKHQELEIIKNRKASR